MTGTVPLWYGARMNSISYSDTEGLKALFFGRRIVAANDGFLTLDDGTVLEVVGNEGCSGCPAGYYEVTEVATCDNAITNVSVEDEGEDAPDDRWYAEDGPRTYRLFVYTENQKIAAATLDGTDGNGYYGTGFRVNVRVPA